MTNCEAQNNWTDSGDRGAARHEHDREFHPDHTHVWALSTYSWEQAGTGFWVNRERRVRTEADVPYRCAECNLTREDNHEGQCSPEVRM